MADAETNERMRELSAEVRAANENIQVLSGRVAALEKGEQSTDRNIARLEGKVDAMESKLGERMDKMLISIDAMRAVMIRRRAIEQMFAGIGDLVKVILGGIISVVAVHFLGWR